jgi:hypothetical protein
MFLLGMVAGIVLVLVQAFVLAAIGASGTYDDMNER